MLVYAKLLNRTISTHRILDMPLVVLTADYLGTGTETNIQINILINIHKYYNIHNKILILHVLYKLSLVMFTLQDIYNLNLMNRRQLL